MITRQDLKQAIAECQYEKNPNANTCIKLAAFLTIERELYGEEKKDGYSFTPDRKIEIESDSDFARAIDGKELREVMPVLDELMQTLEIIQPRLYTAVMEKLI